MIPFTRRKEWNRSNETLSRRTLYGVWHLSDFVASTFGIAPPLTIGHDGQLELPCSEALWQARNETEWKEARLTDLDHGRSATTTVREAFALLVGGSDQESPPITDIAALQWSPFAVVSIMHILSTQLWHMNHGSLSGFTSAKPGSPVAPESAEGEAQMSVAKLFAVGRRCHDLIRAYSDDIEQGGNKNAGRQAKDAKWQLANAADVLRICYGRTMPALAHLDCDSLLRGGLGDVTLAIQEFVAVPLERNAEFTLAASMAYEGLCIPLRYGAHLFRKAGALNGSLENLIAGWDSGEFNPWKLPSYMHMHAGAPKLTLAIKHCWCQNGSTSSVLHKLSARSWTKRSESCSRASPPCCGKRRRSRTRAAPSRRDCCGTGPASTMIPGCGEVSLTNFPVRTVC